MTSTVKRLVSVALICAGLAAHVVCAAQVLLHDDFNRTDGPVGNGWSAWNGSSIQNGELKTLGASGFEGGIYRLMPVTLPVSFSFDFRSDQSDGGGWDLRFNAAPVAADWQLDPDPSQVRFLQYRGSGGIDQIYQNSSGTASDQAAFAAGASDFSASYSHISGVVNADLSSQITITGPAGTAVYTFPAPPNIAVTPPGGLFILSNSSAYTGPHYFDNLVIRRLAEPIQYPTNGHYYEVVPGPISWEDAKVAAESRLFLGMRGHLATVTSEDEVLFVSSHLAIPDPNGAWTGASQPEEGAGLAPDEGWQWVTGEPWEYTNWYSGEPNDYGRPEWALVMSQNGKWNDLYGTYLHPGGYIVEYESEDTTPPAISIASPTDGTYDLNQAVAASYSCTDSGSGVASCIGTVADGAPIDTGTVGTKTFTVTATDNAGNTATKTVTYSVGYRVCLLYDPNRSVKSGATFPIKVQLCDANGQNVSSQSIGLTAQSVIQLSTNAPGSLEDSGNANPDFNFRYDSTLGGTGGYIFNLSTKGYGTGTYSLKFTAGGEPLTHAAQFQVK